MSHDTMLTSDVCPQPHQVAWRWRRAVGDERNDYFQFGTPESLAVGGGGHFAIFLQVCASIDGVYFTLHSYMCHAFCAGGAMIIKCTASNLQQYVLQLQEDLLRGSSGISATFGNPCLAGSTEFAVGKLEVWAVLPT